MVGGPEILHRADRPQACHELVTSCHSQLGAATSCVVLDFASMQSCLVGPMRHCETHTEAPSHATVHMVSLTGLPTTVLLCFHTAVTHAGSEILPLPKRWNFGHMLDRM